MQNKEYWGKRFTLLEQKMHNKSAYDFKKISGIYREASNDINKIVNAFIGKVARDNKITPQQARQMLTEAEMREFKSLVKDYTTLLKKSGANSRLINRTKILGARQKISQLESIQAEIELRLNNMLLGVTDEVGKSIASSFIEAYERTAFEISKGTTLGINFGGVNSKKLNMLLTTPWTDDGKTFVMRFGEDATKIVNGVQKTLAKMCLNGDNPHKYLPEIAKTLDNDKVRAGKILFTENAYFTERAKDEVYQELEIDKYRFIATLDEKTCSICGGLDGQVFDIKDKIIGVNAPVMHPLCRCTTTPYVEDFIKSERIYRDKHKNVGYVDNSMTFEEWKNKFL